MLKPARLRALSSCHRAGMAWPDAIRATLEGDPALPGMLRVLEEEQGSVSDALAPVLDPVGRALVRAGESSGRLEQALLRVAEEQEGRRKASHARRIALAYPLAVTHIGAVLAAFPDFLNGRYGQGVLWALAILVPVYIGVALTRRMGSRSLGKAGRLGDDAAVLRAFGVCVDAGVPFEEATTLARGVAPASRAGNDMARAAACVARGDSLASAWQEIDEDAGIALRQAEHVGELGAVARRESTRLREDAELARKVSLARLPVIMILIVGAVVAWRIFSFYADYLNMGFELKR